jgi:hypothetical protein
MLRKRRSLGVGHDLDSDAEKASSPGSLKALKVWRIEKRDKDVNLIPPSLS